MLWDSSDPWRAATVRGVVVVLLTLLCYAITISYLDYKRRKRLTAELSPEEFITARGRVSSLSIAFSWFATSMGSWCLVTPPSYGSFAGLLGVIMYAVACGGAVVSMAYIGGAARALYPEACSLPDFMRRRFSGRAAASGRLAQGLAVTMNLFNMCVALAAEYTTFLELLRSYSGLPFRIALCLLIAMALATLAYTIAGGLFVSIMTDRLQAIAALSLVGVLLVFTASVVPWDGLPPLSPELKGYTYSGYSSILTMPLGLLVGGALFSEAMWQRVWAIEERRAMARAAWTAGFAVAAVIFFFGFVGFLAVWSGKATAETNMNLYFFAIFNDSPIASLTNLPGYLSMLCACIMSAGAADSMQNAIAATVGSSLLRGRPLWTTRACVVLCNAALLLVACASVPVLSLFLTSNLAATCLMPSVMMSLIPGTCVRAAVTEGSLMLGAVGGVGGLSAYGIYKAGGGLGAGLALAWLGNEYAYDYFLVALGGASVGVVVGVTVGLLLRSCSPGNAGADADYAAEFWAGSHGMRSGRPRKTELK
ncbi:hypothetical protein EMIHUDRAFT_199381 [Emiliania huxleyi CCMP1516]|uniref:Uncharacterized protein n=2 Tax=Emiliania huxleyi TaxID=2903 RepID=A0A0D3KZH5_EMIH1|nr:hypothetical protein EMIHUDRAFT_199381 [Emiliania huxleyi CCMP1516]EOD41160.1 hypothetical protein EMIHUDRAFT_199381 [Emiliania huxleyi CCMP1516]|eukprot:XP_005793589.1 hypothetical protein EMIHUDRAFT_199381 [Emiliania huxleyi CCMP1516]